MRLPPVARSRSASKLASTVAFALTLAFAVVSSAFVQTAAAEPSFQPLTGEPIIRTLEAGDSPTSSVAFTKPALTKPALTKPALTKPALTKPVPADALQAKTQASSAKAEARTEAITKRQLGLYGIVVLSLLGVMVIAIWLILRRGNSARNSSRDSARNLIDRKPAIQTAVSPPPSSQVLSHMVSPRELHAGDPAWTRPTPLATSDAASAPTSLPSSGASSV